jgi:hypothetical protein
VGDRERDRRSVSAQTGAAGGELGVGLVGMNGYCVALLAGLAADEAVCAGAAAFFIAW